MAEQSWKTYEDVAVYLLDKFSEHLGLEKVGPKEKIKGMRSGTVWEIDGKGFCLDGEGFLIVECRRYTTSKQSQESLGGLAYRIIDSGASGGLIVTPLGIQEGADKVAQAENVTEIRLTPESSRTEYLLEFLNKTFIGMTMPNTMPKFEVTTHITHRAQMNLGIKSTLTVK